ncbi:hypothetical protein [Bacillus wiedmannii]|uniref:Uncharacterized protein n=1 Tax=Bacillus wiedmannii TaxID=1890302 RepID=A0A4U2MDA4_9BACI|nr:hypothetical protein [Bacillus wiedmannii]TKH08484.1 hypothetical protein FC694_29330 [Bacillus wiedmannii]
MYHSKYISFSFTCKSSGAYSCSIATSDKSASASCLYILDGCEVSKIESISAFACHSIGPFYISAIKYSASTGSPSSPFILIARL